EGGESFRANAALKARAAVNLTGLSSLAEDSGLEVPVLGGAPGVHSARFAGAGASSEALIEALLRALGDRVATEPTAYFRTVAVLRLPAGRQFEGEGMAAGATAAAPLGRHGGG